jgi:hypothetical protein
MLWGSDQRCVLDCECNPSDFRIVTPEYFHRGVVPDSYREAQSFAKVELILGMFEKKTLKHLASWRLCGLKLTVFREARQSL